ncbi:hypothetical protein KP509_32G045000 [Ceratopteris richardii]|uniref:DNA-directed DNA polymerase n=1 Tax=Ceratopteris richardii TaxID=49495 RepID=A0A8T2QUG3_CERRI|nr:hypothetical protein KP509_32G045000 [Ceratopteris richardii]
MEKVPRRHYSQKAMVLFQRDPDLKTNCWNFIDEAPPLDCRQNLIMGFSDYRLGSVSDGPNNHFANGTKKRGKARHRNPCSAINVEADHDGDDDTESFHSERSACGMPWYWPGSHRNVHMELSGRCFRVPRENGCRIRIHRKYRYERSMSSFGSESESTLLMTDTDQFHEYNENVATSSVEQFVETPHSMHMNEPCSKSDDTQDEHPAGHSSYGGCLEAHLRTLGISNNRKSRSLSRKYRPKLIKDLIGQPMLVESLCNAIVRDKVAPVYLFHGPRGTGKTTAAKLFAAAINCLSTEESRPCGLCKECSSLNIGQNLDIKEVDASGSNHAESIRYLLSDILRPPIRARYKVVVVDDCHTLNVEAWNVLLKGLEDPPGFVVFILVTTDLELLPRTAMSRCQKFMFVRIKETDIVERLQKLASHEKIEIDIEALQFIASRSDGSLRDAENLLDQSSLLESRATLARVQEMAGLISDDKLFKLLESALSADSASTVNTIREFMEIGMEPLALTSQLASLITDILAGRRSMMGSITGANHIEEQSKLKEMLRILSEAENQLRYCNDRTTWLTAAFLRFIPVESRLLPSPSRGVNNRSKPTSVFSTASVIASNRSINKDQKESASTAKPCSTDSIWKEVIQEIRPNILKQLLLEEGRLASIAVTEAYSIVYLEFRHPEHAVMAEEFTANIKESFQVSLQCPVEVDIRLPDVPSRDRSVLTKNGQIPIQGKMHVRRMDVQYPVENRFLRMPINSSMNISAVSSPSRNHVKDCGRPRYALEADDRAFGNGFCQNLEVFGRLDSKEGIAYENTLLIQEGRFEEFTTQEHGKTSQVTGDNNADQEQNTLKVAVYSAPNMPENDDRTNIDYSSDSDYVHGDDCGHLCWKGPQVSQNKEKYQMQKRRHGRLLLRLMPCAKGSGMKQAQHGNSHE